MKVSVIVPVYNPGHHIDRCIASLLGQSLPADEYEAIFVDDGSTDGTGERLEALARAHPNVTTIRIPNSGWPGRPRNVGVENARGEFVFFMDNDDWIGDEALERLYERAVANEADVVVGKVVSVGNGINRDTFRHNVDDATLAETPALLLLLTVHRLFRTELLRRHQIRFPEGRVRLEDHHFVMQAYFTARRISILADYPCYYWRRREDASNASNNRVPPEEYYGSVRQVLDIVERHTTPGPLRDRLFAHWYRRKCLVRMGAGSLLGHPREYRLRMYDEIRRLALQRFGASVETYLPANYRVRSRLLHEDRLDALVELARFERGITAEVDTAAVEWTGSTFRVTARAAFRYGNGEPITVAADGERARWQLPSSVPSPGVTPDDTDVTDEIAAPFADVVFRNRETLVEYLGALDARWAKPEGRDDGIPATFGASGTIDLATVAAGQPLGGGTWDAFLRVGFGGWESLRRLPCPPAALRVDGLAPIPTTGLRAQPYVTGPGNLSIRVASANAVSTARAKAGLVRLAHRLPPPVRGALRRAARAVRVR